MIKHLFTSFLFMVVFFFCSCHGSDKHPQSPTAASNTSPLVSNVLLSKLNHKNEAKDTTHRRKYIPRPFDDVFEPEFPNKQIGKQKVDISKKSKVDSNMSLVFNVNKDTSVLNSIWVYDKGKIYQKIKVRQQLYNHSLFLMLIDWDFDGHKDITMLDGLQAQMSDYFIWSYDTLTKKFKYNEELSEMGGIGLDLVHKSFITYNHLGGYDYGYDTMKWINGKLFSNNGFQSEYLNYEFKGESHQCQVLHHWKFAKGRKHSWTDTIRE